MLRTPNVRRALALAGVALVSLGLAACQGSDTFTVRSTSDSGDAQVNGVCATSSGACTLRAAITEANAQAGHHTIEFEIPGSGVKRISPGTRLPALTDPAGVTIDGYSQSGSEVNTSPTASNALLLIELKGQGFGGFDGLVLSSPDNVIRGLSIWDFRVQVLMRGSNAHDNQVIGSFVGTNPAGTAGATRFEAYSHGVLLDGGASDNRVGVSGDENRNVISGNWQNGVNMYNVDTRRNRVQNNLVGLRPNGLAALPNRSHGLDMNEGTADTLVGGLGFGERNVVAGNSQSGIEISHGTATVGNDVIGNLIGTGVNGTTAVRNGQYGVFLEGLAQCSTSCPANAGESTVAGNVIVNNAGGVAIQKGRHDDVVSGNRIGVLTNGATASNAAFGVRIEKGSHRTRIGPDNTIARNGSGVQIQAIGSNPTTGTGTAEARTFANTITRNRIFLNTRLGIDLAPLDAVTANPPQNVNDSVNIPVLSLSGNRVRATTCQGCTVELFRADTTSTSEFGEGQTFFASVQADSSGVALFPSGFGRGGAVTATTTDTAGNTSEFSRNIAGPPS